MCGETADDDHFLFMQINNEEEKARQYVFKS